MATALLDEDNNNNSNDITIELELIPVDTAIETTPPHISHSQNIELPEIPSLLNIDLTDPKPPINAVNEPNKQTTNITSDNYNEQFIRLKKHTKGKRKSTFCCIFSCGALILTIILLIAPLSTKMIDDWQTYNKSVHTQCKLSSKNPLNNTLNNTLNNVCNYEYITKDGHNFNDKCGNKMYQNASCSVNINNDNECFFFTDNKNKNNCVGTMINISQLQRNNSMFVVLLGIGCVFGIITIICSIYAISLIHSYGIYLSIISIQNDDEKVFELMQKSREKHKHKKRKKHKKKRRRDKEKSDKQKLIEQHKRKHKHKYRRRKMEKSYEHDSVLSSQFSSATINSLHTINSTDVSTVHSQISIDML